MCDLSGRVHWDVWQTDQLHLPVDAGHQSAPPSSHIVMLQRERFWEGSSTWNLVIKQGFCKCHHFLPFPPVRVLNCHSFCKTTPSQKTLCLHFIAVCLFLICLTSASHVYIATTTKTAIGIITNDHTNPTIQWWRLCSLPIRNKHFQAFCIYFYFKFPTKQFVRFYKEIHTMQAH